MSKRGYDDVTKKKAAVDPQRDDPTVPVFIPAASPAPKNPTAPQNPSTPTLPAPAPKNPTAPIPNLGKNHAYAPSCCNCLKNVLLSLGDLDTLELVLLDYPCLKSMKDHRVFSSIMEKAVSVGGESFAARLMLRHGIFPVDYDEIWLSKISLAVVGEIFKNVQDYLPRRENFVESLFKRRGIKSLLTALTQGHISPSWGMVVSILRKDGPRNADLDFLEDIKKIIVCCCGARKDAAPLVDAEIVCYCYAIINIFNCEEWRKTVDLSRIEEPYHAFPIINLLLEIITGPDSEAMKITVDKQFLMQCIQKTNNTPIKPEAVLFLLKYNVKK